MWDLQIHKPEIVQQISWVQTSPQDVLSSAIDKQNQTIIEWMKQSLLKVWISKEKVWTLKFSVVWNIWIVISRWKLHSWYKYSKENWVEYYTNLPWLDKDEDLPFAQKKSWYELIDWKIFKKWEEIPQFLSNWRINPDFVKWIDDVTFYIEAQVTFWLMKSVIEWNKIKFDIKWMYLSIVRWIMRIKDVMYFASKWYVPEKDFEKLLLRAIQELPNQCSDTRFNNLVLWEKDWKKITMEVTKSELDEYLKPTKWPPLITQSMYDNCLKRIEARDRKINEMYWVKEEWKTERKIEWTRNWFVDRVKGILGF